MDYVIPPAGVSAASFFEAIPFADPASPIGVLADKLDARGELASIFVGLHPVDAAIAYQVRLRRASGAAVLDDGQDFARIRKNSTTTEAEIRFEVQRLFQPFVDRGDAELLSVAIQAGEDKGDTGACFVEYRNLRTGRTPAPLQVS